MSAFILDDFLPSRNDVITEKDIKNFKKISKTTKIVKSSIPKIKEINQKPKKININKFLTKVIRYERKRNYDVEKKRFTKLWKEKKNFITDNFSTSRSISGRNRYNNNIPKRLNKSLEMIKPKQLTVKIKSENIVNENNNKKNSKKYKKTLSSEEINKFCDRQENWSKLIQNKKENRRQKIIQRNENILDHYFYPKTNRDYNKTKYKYEKTLDNQKFELDILKQTYKQNQFSYIYKPAINIKKYRNIKPKYNQCNNIINNNKNHLNTKRKDKNNKNNLKKYINSNKNKNHTSRNVNDILPNKKNSTQTNDQTNLLKLLNINNKKKKLINDNRYYLNINETTSCDNFINKIIFKGHNSVIEEMILDKIEGSSKIKKNKQ